MRRPNYSDKCLSIHCDQQIQSYSVLGDYETHIDVGPLIIIIYFHGRTISITEDEVKSERVMEFLGADYYDFVVALGLNK